MSAKDKPIKLPFISGKYLCATLGVTPWMSLQSIQQNPFAFTLGVWKWRPFCEFLSGFVKGEKRSAGYISSMYIHLIKAVCSVWTPTLSDRTTSLTKQLTVSSCLLTCFMIRSEEEHVVAVQFVPLPTGSVRHGSLPDMWGPLLQRTPFWFFLEDLGLLLVKTSNICFRKKQY